MAEPGLEEAKDRLIQAITEVYARGGMDMSSFEREVTSINACADRNALEAEAAGLGVSAALQAPLPPAASPSAAVQADHRWESAPPVEAIALDIVSGSIRKKGDWVRSSVYQLRLKSSSVRLDLREYEGRRGFRLVIEVEAVSSSIRITVPEGFEVEDRFSDRVSSTVRNKLKDGTYGDNRVILVGSLRSSTVRIKSR